MPTLRILVGNCMSVSATRAKASAIFAAMLAQPADVWALSECSDFRTADLAPGKQVIQVLDDEGQPGGPDSALVIVADQDVRITDVRLAPGTPRTDDVRRRPILLATVDGVPLVLGHAPRMVTGLQGRFMDAMERHRGVKVGDFNMGRTLTVRRFSGARVHSAGLLHAVTPVEPPSSAQVVPKWRLAGADHNALVLTVVTAEPAPIPAPPQEAPVMAKPYLIEHPPARRQFKARGTTFSGVVVVHTAESAPDVTGMDLGAEGVAKFIRGRSDPGCYHYVADSDSLIHLVPLDQQTYGDGTGSNPHAVHISAATQAAKWDALPREWTEATVKNMALAAHKASDYCFRLHGVRIPARRVTKAQSSDRMEGFISHGERDPGRRTDPGKSFPWGFFFAEYKRLEGTSPTSRPARKPTRMQQAAALLEAIAADKKVPAARRARARAARALLPK